jgi:hypothetical protein
VKGILVSRRRHYLGRATTFLVATTLIVGMTGCAGCGQPSSQNLEIRTWYDLDAVRDNLAGHHTLMNDLDSTTPGYEELASPIANEGKGWQPIGWGLFAGPWLSGDFFRGSFDGQGYEIHDLLSNGSVSGGGGLFGCVGKGGIIKNIGVINATTTLTEDVDVFVALSQRTVAFAAPIFSSGILVGFNGGSVSDSYTSGTVSGDYNVGGLVGTNTGTVSNCRSAANVTGSAWGVGGLIGSNGLLKYGGSVKYCYSTGSVTGYEHIGGLVGINEHSGPEWSFRGTVGNSFWDVETSGQATSAGGTGKTTAEMKDITTFTDTDWDIIAVADSDTRDTAYTWNIVDGETYPFLSWEVQIEA